MVQMCGCLAQAPPACAALAGRLMARRISVTGLAGSGAAVVLNAHLHAHHGEDKATLLALRQHANLGGLQAASNTIPAEATSHTSSSTRSITDDV